MKADGYKQIVKELRFAAEYGCDSELIDRAADALEEAADQIERSASEKSGKTVYIRANNFTQRADLQKIEDDLNMKSEDKIIVLPCCMEILNPEELEAVKKEDKHA